MIMKIRKISLFGIAEPMTPGHDRSKMGTISGTYSATV
jgi:hypothetical protein